MIESDLIQWKIKNNIRFKKKIIFEWKLTNILFLLKLTKKKNPSNIDSLYNVIETIGFQFWI